MDAVFLELLNRSIAAGWLVLAVVALRALLWRAPKQQRCHLWGLVILRLLLPSLRKTAYSLIPSAQTIRPEILLSSEPSIQTGFVAVDQAVNPVLAESFAPAVGDSVNPLQVWVHLGAVLWLCGMAAMLLYAVVSYLRLRRRVADSVPLRDNIRLSDRIDSPFVLGLLRPRIYLPFGLDEETQALVLAHEQGHIDRNDDWVKPFGFLFLALCWFHPLAWLAYVLFCRDIELACDEHVLRTQGPEIKKAYSAALLSCSMPGHTPGVCPLAFGQSDVKLRIRNVLAYKKPTFWIHLAAAFAAAVLCVCFLTDPMEHAADAASEMQGPDRTAQWSDFLSELIRVESADGSYGGPLTYVGYACSYDAPLLRFPWAERNMTDSGYVFVWDDGLGRLRIKELWYDEAGRKALVVRWSPGAAEADPAYTAEADPSPADGLRYPRYAWSQSTVDSSFDFEGTWVDLHYYQAEEPIGGYIKLTEGMHFASAESLLSPQQLTVVRMSRLSALELGGYEQITREELSARWGAPLLTLPELPARFQSGDILYVMGTELERPRFAAVWTNEEDGKLLFASWRRNPGPDSPLQMSYERPNSLHGWVNFLAEARGRVSDTDVVLRYYDIDGGTSPEAVRHFLEHVEMAESEPSKSGPMLSYRVGLSGEADFLYDAAITVPVGMIAPIRPALGLDSVRPSGVGMDIFDAGYLQLFNSEDGQPCLLAKVPTASPVRVEVHTLKETYTLAVSVVPNDSGLAYHLYDEPDPAEVSELSIRLNGRPLTDFTTSAGLFYELYAQCTPGGQVLAEWSSSDESVARVTVRVDGCCVLETLRPSREPVTITAVYGGHRAEMTLTVG
ncbi:MAG: hypothetical protein IKO83_09505 [Oscillospiraceae bacterium]|nr:hypothetical protein [Oscillospiraceae bacterium]